MTSKQGYLKLRLAWTALFAVALLVTLAGAKDGNVYPLNDDYYGDACQDTCPDNCASRFPLELFTQECCTFDWGCLLNPFQPNDQIWLSTRERVACVLPPEEPGMPGQVVICCGRWREAMEESGPCCVQQHWNCPP